VNDAIQSSGILKRFPAIDLEKQKTGIFGKFVKLDAVLQDGDRVEIYRPLTVDPKTVPKRAKRVGEVADSPDA
jgi:putative ubiquitin-RnfH superfamily antitoxin RatB of RatAB toxin-antitoxin module